jgi:hypothetical protein
MDLPHFVSLFYIANFIANSPKILANWRSYYNVYAIFPYRQQKKNGDGEKTRNIRGSGFPLLESTFFAVHCLPRLPTKTSQSLVFAGFPFLYLLWFSFHSSIIES